jgi:hypothetical protein
LTISPLSQGCNRTVEAHIADLTLPPRLISWLAPAIG